MTFEQLKCFFEVAHSRSFSKAAETLFLSQSNLSKYIKKLEEELGVVLFDRNTHYCRLTEAGSLFMRQTEDLFFHLNSRIEDTKLRSRNRYEPIYIGISPGEPPVAEFMDLLSELNRASKRYRYILQGFDYTTLINKLSAHEVDLIVTTDRNAREIKEFDQCRLAQFQMLLAVHKDNPKARNPALEPSDCEDEMVFISIPDGKNAPISRIQEFDLHTGGNLSANILPSPADLLYNVSIHAGVALLPKTVDPTRYPDIRFYSFEERRSEAGQYLLWRKGQKNPAVLHLLELAKTICE